MKIKHTLVNDEGVNSTITCIYIFVLIASISNLFGFSNIIFPGFFANDSNYFVLLAASLTYFIGAVFLKNRAQIYISKPFGWLMIGLLTLIVAEIIMTEQRYGQAINQTLKEAVYYFTPIIAYFALYNLNRSKPILPLMKVMFKDASLLVGSLSIIEYFLLKHGVDVLKLGTTVSTRYGAPRFEIATILFVVTFIIIVSDFIDANKDVTIQDLICLILVGYNLIWVSKGRSLIVYLLISVFLSLILTRKLSTGIKIVILILMVAIIVLSLRSQIQGLIISLTKEDAGVAIRFEEIDYYVSQVRQHPLLGIGLISERSQFSQILMGSEGLFYQSDVGIIGYISKFGLIGLLWLIIWFYHSFVVVLRRQAGSFQLTLLIFLLISNVSLSMMDYNKTIYLVIAMISFEQGISKTKQIAFR